MQSKDELLKQVVANTHLGNKKGVISIILGERFGYPLGMIRSRSSKKPVDFNVLSLGITEGKELGFIDFVFDHTTGFIGITFSKKLNPHGHDGIADSLYIAGASGSDSRRATMVGGKIAFLNNMFVSTEWSGHYGADLWNARIIEHFQSIFYWTTKQPILHINWRNSDPEQERVAGAVVPSEHVEKQHSRLMTFGLFCVNNRATADGVKANTPLTNDLSKTVVSYLPPK
ncbi:polymorphic toxin type 43 domain-containing protein [Legionella sp. 227]|uniref:polymorphic toxin type 43 domain-containing protein n=1 Tax=Legionella sp. 227 TaxID=3367288 RepID=UPI00370D2C68